MYKSKRIASTIWTVLLIAVAVWMGTEIHAALVRPLTIEGMDFVSEEPFKGYRTVRSSLILTNAYVDTDVLDVRQYRKIALLLDVTKGSLTSVEYRIWTSIDNKNWFVEATESVAAATITDTAATYTTQTTESYYKILNLYPAYVKLSVKGTGTVTGSLLEVTIVGVM